MDGGVGLRIMWRSGDHSGCRNFLKCGGVYDTIAGGQISWYWLKFTAETLSFWEEVTDDDSGGNGVRIKDIYLKGFKRFTDLTIEGIPDTAKLVILVGPSGSGKSALLDAINAWAKDYRYGYDLEYYRKDGQSTNSGPSERFENLGVSINADDCPSNLGEACYMRSAYRHTPKFSVSTMEKIDESIYSRDQGQRNSSTTDAEVERNYQRVYRQIVREVFHPEERTNSEIKEMIIGQVRDCLRFIFSELHLHSLDNPEGEGTFYFEKGDAKKYNYVNLSGGEKAAFDLLLDFISGKSITQTQQCVLMSQRHTWG